MGEAGRRPPLPCSLNSARLFDLRLNVLPECQTGHMCPLPTDQHSNATCVGVEQTDVDYVHYRRRKANVSDEHRTLQQQVLYSPREVERDIG